MQSEARLVEYTVLDVEPTSPRGAAGKGQQQQQREQQGGRRGGKRVTNAMIEVAMSTDFGVNDNTHIALSHLVRYARQAAALRAARPRRAARGRRGVSAHLAAIGDACAAAQSGRGAAGGADPVARRKQMSTAAACAAVFVPYMQDRAQVEELGTLMIESAPVVLTAPLWKSLHLITRCRLRDQRSPRTLRHHRGMLRLWPLRRTESQRRRTMRLCPGHRRTARC